MWQINLLREVRFLALTELEGILEESSTRVFLSDILYASLQTYESSFFETEICIPYTHAHKDKDLP